METDDIKIATFHSHYGAMMFRRRMGDDAKLVPVPRSLSSSCGTAVVFTSCFDVTKTDENTEAVYERNGDEWRVIWKR